MQDFSLGKKPEAKAEAENHAVDISVSGVFDKDGKKIAYVSFSDGGRLAEGTVPDCVITRNRGFSDDEIRQLEEYMRRELPSIKKLASGINVVKALME